MSITWKAQGDANIYALLQDGHWFARVQLNGEMSDAQQESIMSQLAAAPDLLHALYTALPYVEDAQADPAYKPGAIARVVKQLRDAITKAEDAL